VSVHFIVECIFQWKAESWNFISRGSAVMIFKGPNFQLQVVVMHPAVVPHDIAVIKSLPSLI
jgi:hypothetical protein